MCDAEASLFGPEGERRVPFADVFQGRLRPLPGEMLVRVRAPVWALAAKHAHIKKTTNEKIDYPLVNVTALFYGEALRAAFSGVCAQPFRSERMEAILNERALCPAERARLAVAALPERAHADVEGSGEYRAFVLEHTLKKLLEDWELGSL